MRWNDRKGCAPVATRLALPVLWLVILLAGVSATVSAESGDDDKTLDVAALDWPPYYGPDLAEGGVFARITRAAFERVGYSIDIDWMPWQRALTMGERGRYDLVLGGYDAPERREVFYYSEVVMHAEESLVVRADFPRERYDSLKDLSGYRIGHLQGAVHADAFDTADYLDKHASDNYETLIRKLAHGRNDIIAMSYRAFRYYRTELEDIGDVAFRPLKPPLQRNGLYNLFPRSLERSATLRQRFNEGLERLRAEGVLNSMRGFD